MTLVLAFFLSAFLFNVRRGSILTFPSTNFKFVTHAHVNLQDLELSFKMDTIFQTPTSTVACLSRTISFLLLIYIHKDANKK
uniref:Secreted protein n=1 Tax=Octopus bimaculoides TaxID=37653 RepID=A0A0L8I5E0_OCTBM